MFEDENLSPKKRNNNCNAYEKSYWDISQHWGLSTVDDGGKRYEKIIHSHAFIHQQIAL
jgi:hypothetical protein